MRGQAEAIDWGGEGETENGESPATLWLCIDLGWRHLLALISPFCILSGSIACCCPERCLSFKIQLQKKRKQNHNE